MTEESDLPETVTSAAAKQGDAAHAARSGAVQVLTILAQALLTVSHVLLARLFGQIAFGIYQTAAAILEVTTRGGTGGADKGMLRYIAGHRARDEPDLVRRSLGTGLRLCLVVAGTAGLLVFFAAGPIARIAHEPALIPVLRLMAPCAVFTGTMWVLVQASLATKSTRANFIVRGLGEPSFILIAGLTAALFGRSVVNLAMAHVAASIATFVLAVVVVSRLFGRGELGRALRSPPRAGFIQFSIPLGLADLMNAVLQRADIVLLSVFLGPGVTAVYTAAEFITRVIANSRYVFDSVAAPVFSEAVHLDQRDRLQDNLVMMTRWVATAAAPIAVTVVVLRRDLLSLYGPSFQQGATALAILALGHLINSTFGLAGWILLVSGRSRLILMNNVIVAVVNVVMGLLLIPRFGAIGTALAALGGVSLLHLLVVLEVRAIHGVHPIRWSVAKPFVAASIAFGCQWATARGLASTAVRIPSVIVVGLLSYLLALFAIGIAPEDRKLLTRAADRVLRWTGRRA